MTFPSFRTTGGTVDIPTIPLERKALDLTPLIQQLMMNKKATSAAVDKTKKDDKDPDIVGTTGQTGQWFDLYKNNQKQIESLTSWYGPEVAVRSPDYRRLIEEQDNITNPAIKQMLLNNKDRLKTYDDGIAAKKASGLINLDAIARGNPGISHGDWSQLMQNAQVSDGLQMTDKNKMTWIDDFDFAPYIATPDDAIKAIDERYGNIGSSEYSSGGSSNRIYQDLKGDWVFLVNEHNSSMTKLVSNNNIYGENPTSIGQLNSAKQAVLRTAFSSFLGNVTGDNIQSGLAAGFLGKTATMVPASKVGLPGNKNVKAMLQTKAYGDKFIDEEPVLSNFANDKGEIDKSSEESYKKAYEEWDEKNKEAGKNYSKTHDGYYWKAGQKNENGEEIGGHLDGKSLLGDYERYVYDIVNEEHNKRIQTVDSKVQDQKINITTLTDWQQDHNNKKIAEAEVAGANQVDFTVEAVGNLGILEEDLKKLYNDEETFTSLWGMTWPSYDKSKITSPQLDQLVYEDGVSPFIINQTNDGRRTYLPNPNFNGESIDAFYSNQKNHALNQLEMTEAQATSYANAMTKKATHLHKTISDNLVAKGHQGAVAYDGTKSVITTADPEVNKYYNDNWYEGTGEKKVGKTGASLFGNQLAQVGSTVTEGRGFFGDAFRFASVDEERSFVNLGIASNSGVKVKSNVTVNNREYKPGDFIHLSVVDQMTLEQLADFNNKVDYGTNGYWNINNGKATTNGKPNKTGKVTGMGPNSERILLTLNSTGGPNAIAESPTSIMSTVDMVGKKSDVINYWTKERTTLKREVPNFVKEDDRLKKLWNEAEKASNQYSITRSSTDENLIKGVAKKLKIEEGTAAYRTLEKAKGKNHTERSIIFSEALAIKYNVSGSANWDKRKTLIDEEIVENGKIKDFAKQQLYLKEETNSNGDVFYRVKAGVEVQAQLKVANSTKANTMITTYDQNRLKRLNTNTTDKTIKVNPQRVNK